MIDPHPWTGRYAGAFFAGVIVALYLLIVAYGYSGHLNWLERWQTLVAGGVAVVAAIGSIAAVNSQTRTAEKAEASRHTRKVASARVAIAAPLSVITELQRSLLREFSDYLSSNIESPAFLGVLSTPAVSNELLSQLIPAIENSDSPASEDIAELVAELQVQVARLTPLRSNSIAQSSSGRLEQNIRAYAFDALFLYARCQRLFYYVRRQDDQYVETSMEEVLKGSGSIEQTRCNISNEQLADRLARRDGDWLARQFTH
jgi:hypothetical protein